MAQVFFNPSMYQVYHWCKQECHDKFIDIVYHPYRDKKAEGPYKIIGRLIDPCTNIKSDKQDDAILIPTQAVIPAINEQTVFVYKSGKAVQKVIQMGNRNADKVLVLSGISVGDTVITTGLLNIKEGMDLTIQSIK